MHLNRDSPVITLWENPERKYDDFVWFDTTDEFIVYQPQSGTEAHNRYVEHIGHNDVHGLYFRKDHRGDWRLIGTILQAVRCTYGFSLHLLTTDEIIITDHNNTMISRLTPNTTARTKSDWRSIINLQGGDQGNDSGIIKLAIDRRVRPFNCI